jgi:hypothetical protein
MKMNLIKKNLKKIKSNLLLNLLKALDTLEIQLKVREKITYHNPSSLRNRLKSSIPKMVKRL